MRNAAIVLIVVALAGLGVLLLTQANNISSQSRKDNHRDILGSPARPSPAPGPAPSASTSGEPVEAASGSVDWERNLVRATEDAKAGNKIIIVDVYTDWCGWCKKMDEDIYSNSRVVGLSRQEIFLKLDAEDGGQGEGFASRMNVKGYPTTIILDSDGKRITEKRGFIPSPDEFIQFVEGARAGRRG